MSSRVSVGVTRKILETTRQGIWQDTYIDIAQITHTSQHLTMDSQFSHSSALFQHVDDFDGHVSGSSRSVARVCISTSWADSFTCQFLSASFFHVAFLALERVLTLPHDRLNVHHAIELSYRAVFLYFTQVLSSFLFYIHTLLIFTALYRIDRQHDPVSRWQRQHLLRNRLSLPPSLRPWSKARRLELLHIFRL
jgi:hypothetical protein